LQSRQVSPGQIAYKRIGSNSVVELVVLLVGRQILSNHDVALAMLHSNAEQLERVSSKVARQRSRRTWALSADERMARFDCLQTSLFTSLFSNPVGYASFKQRNHHARRQSQVRELEAIMRSGTSARSGAIGLQGQP
jgi:hypothetical protein